MLDEAVASCGARSEELEEMLLWTDRLDQLGSLFLEGQLRGKDRIFQKIEIQ